LFTSIVEINFFTSIHYTVLQINYFTDSKTKVACSKLENVGQSLINTATTSCNLVLNTGQKKYDVSDTSRHLMMQFQNEAFSLSFFEGLDFFLLGVGVDVSLNALRCKIQSLFRIANPSSKIIKIVEFGCNVQIDTLSVVNTCPRCNWHRNPFQNSEGFFTFRTKHIITT
jgi:hypothetical protein